MLPLDPQLVGAEVVPVDDGKTRLEENLLEERLVLGACGEAVQPSPDLSKNLVPLEVPTLLLHLLFVVVVAVDHTAPLALPAAGVLA